MPLKIKGIPENKLKKCIKTVAEKFGKSGIMVLDRALYLAIRESMDLDDALAKIENILPLQSEMDYGTIRQMSYNPLCVSGWSPDRSTWMICFDAGILDKHVRILKASTSKDITAIRGRYVTALMNRAKAIRDNK